MHRIAWDDLRYVLAVAEAGSLAAAARTLGVNHTTVLRRVGGFEAGLGLRLFERLPTGYALTAGGEELVAAARSIDGTVTALERKLAGQDLRLVGTLRLTTTDTLMASVLPPVLAAFRAEHPGIGLEISVSNLMANLTKRDADVAIRPAKEPPETLVGRRVAGVEFAVYGAQGYLAGRDEVGDLAGQIWVGPDDSLAGTSVARWMRSALPSACVAVRADSFVAMRQAAAAGLGLVALPCYLGDTSDGLRRIWPPVPELATELWVLTHEDLRRTARVRVFTEFAADALAARRDLLEGRRP
ncbi:MAG TPA: LysR family transcriptional regulator [Geminicoccaceae bacterium]|nr:LysR family transcriptional regulator [Geminicoccaceae bacterium]